MIDVTKHVQQSRNLQSILSFGSWPVKPKIFKVLRRKWQPTPVFLPENTTDRGAWWARVLGVEKSWTRLSYFHSLIQSLEGDIILSAYLVKERFWNTDLPFHLRSEKKKSKLITKILQRWKVQNLGSNTVFKTDGELNKEVDL